VGGLRKYSIPFKGLVDGQHGFRFDIDKTFFDEFDSSEIKTGKLTAEINLLKEPQLLEIEFVIHGVVDVICDRCLDNFGLQIQYKGSLFFKFGEVNSELTDEIILLSGGQTEINVAQYLYEFIHLSLPYTKVHPVVDGISGCDPDMIEKLDALSIKGSVTEDSDPRWDILKEINNKN